MIARVSRTAGLIARPALAAVLVALTDLGDAQEAVLSGRVTAWRLEDRGVHFRWDGVPYFALYFTRDPDEAWEILDARGLLPPEGKRSFSVRAAIMDIVYNAPPRDRSLGGSSGKAGFRVYADGTARRPTYAIERGGVRLDAVLSDDENDERFTVEGALLATARQWPCPATIPDLVAWASLGAEAIVTAEALAVEACRDLREWGVAPCERAVWRVGEVRLADGSRGYSIYVPGARSFRDDGGLVTSAPSIRALWDMGLALERVGVECVLCVPPVPSSALGSIDTNPLYDAPPSGS